MLYWYQTLYSWVPIVIYTTKLHHNELNANWISMSDLQLLGNCHSSNCLAECSTSGVGVTRDISAIGNFLHYFQRYKNTFYLLIIMFIFVRCHRSYAALTPVKYEHDLKNLTRDFILSETYVTKKITNGALVPPTPVVCVIPNIYCPAQRAKSGLPIYSNVIVLLLWFASPLLLHPLYQMQ